jgi:hypothetical protein
LKPTRPEPERFAARKTNRPPAQPGGLFQRRIISEPQVRRMKLIFMPRIDEPPADWRDKIKTGFQTAARSRIEMPNRSERAMPEQPAPDTDNRVVSISSSRKFRQVRPAT